VPLASPSRPSQPSSTASRVFPKKPARTVGRSLLTLIIILTYWLAACGLNAVSPSRWLSPARGIEDEAQPRGYSLFLCNCDEDPQKEINYIHVLRRHRIMGLIASTAHEDPAWVEALQNLAAQASPSSCSDPIGPLQKQCRSWLTTKGAL
jgi:hypothetical protein